MSFVPNDGKSNKCTKCGKTVYPNESIRACNGVYHKGCLKCTQCSITLNLKSVMSHQNKPYCRTHVPKVGQSQTRGGGGAAPARGGAAPAARAAPRGGGGGYKGPNTMKVGGGGNKCPGCNKTVYQNEEIVACAGRWHKGCLKCGQCNITLNIKTVQSHQNRPYCKTHVPKIGHTQVASVEMQSAMKAPKAARAVKGVNRAARGTFAPGALNAVAGANVVNKGGVGGSDIQSAHAPKQTFVAPEPAASITYDTPDEQFSNMSVSDNAGGYDAGGYDEGGYDAGGYEEASYDQGGYEEPAYDEGGYAEGGYEEAAYDEGGYAEEGYAEEGYDEGYAEEGYAEEGYAEEGYDEGYDEGYAEGGYDEGYYEEGYDEGGYDEGYYDEGY